MLCVLPNTQTKLRTWSLTWLIYNTCRCLLSQTPIFPCTVTCLLLWNESLPYKHGFATFSKSMENGQRKTAIRVLPSEAKSLLRKIPLLQIGHFSYYPLLMCMCVCVSMYVSTRVNVCECVLVCMSVCMWVCALACVCLSVCKRGYVYVCTLKLEDPTNPHLSKLLLPCLLSLGK